jgi:hypothetical protein
MTTKCPECGKYVEFSEIDAHLAAHDRADAVGRAAERVSKMSTKQLAARMRKMGRHDLADKLEKGE